MRRKIIPHGPSSLTVSLPSSWVKKYNLSKGDEIDVESEESILKITPVNMIQESKEKEISFVGLSDDTWQDLMVVLHSLGYNKLKITYENKSLPKKIDTFLTNMQLGFEIVSESDNSITIDTVLNPTIDQFDTLFRKIFQVTIEYGKKIYSVMNDLENLTTSHLNHEKSMKRFSNYCKRMNVLNNSKDSCFLHNIMTTLETIAGYLTSFLDEIERINKSLPQEIIDEYKKIVLLLEDIYNLNYKFSLEEYERLNIESSKISKDILNFKSKDNDENHNYWEYLEFIHKVTHKLFIPILSLNTE